MKYKSQLTFSRGSIAIVAVFTFALLSIYSVGLFNTSSPQVVFAEETSNEVEVSSTVEETDVSSEPIKAEQPTVEDEAISEENKDTVVVSSMASVDIFANGSADSLTIVSPTEFSLDWISANVVSCKLFADTQDLGGVPKTGSAGPVGVGHPFYPNVGGSKAFTITCNDLSGQSVSDTVTVFLIDEVPTCVAPVITSTLSASGTVGQPFSYSINATGSLPILYNASPLKGWLSIGTSTGVLSGTPTTTGNYTVEIYASNSCGEDAKALNISVSSQGDENVTTTLSANPQTITSGGSSTLTWSSTNATACSAPWTSATSTSGSMVVSLSTTTTFSITCTKNTLSSSATTTVVVVSDEGPSCTIPVFSSPNTISGKVGTTFSYTLSATSTGTSSIVYSAGEANLPAGLSFSTSTNTISGVPTQSGTFIVFLSAKNTCGEGVMNLTITIDPNGGGGGNQVTTTLSANPQTITSGGSSTLTWSSTNATACSAPWTSATSTSGSMVVSPSSTTEYTITCTNSSMGASASTTITVNQPNTSGGGSRSRGGSSRAVPQVLGVALTCDYLEDYLRIDWNNDPIEVIKLQVFLRELEGFKDLEITGVFDRATYDAVGIFQERYESDILTPWGHESSTSFVYILTKKKVNEIVCNRAFPLNSSQVEEIQEFRAFMDSLKLQGVSVPGLENEAESSQGQNKGQVSDNSGSILSQNGMNFIGYGSIDAREGTTSSTSTVFVDNSLRNIAAAVIAGPANLDESLNALLVFMAILLVIHLIVQARVRREAQTGLLTLDVQKIHKMSYFSIGLFIATLGCLLFGFYSIVLPLTTLLVILCIATLWMTFQKKEIRTVTTIQE